MFRNPIIMLFWVWLSVTAAAPALFAISNQAAATEQERGAVVASLECKNNIWGARIVVAPLRPGGRVNSVTKSGAAERAGLQVGMARLDVSTGSQVLLAAWLWQTPPIQIGRESELHETNSSLNGLPQQ